MIAAGKIAEVMGGKKILKRDVRSLQDLRALVNEGVPKSVLRYLFDQVTPTSAEATRYIYQVVPEATYKRRGLRLKPDESERTERIARVMATAYYVWGDEREETQRFLLTPHAALGQVPPLTAAQSELGARQVEELLWSMYYGLPV